jgi:hypothetical protein
MEPTPYRVLFIYFFTYCNNATLCIASPPPTEPPSSDTEGEIMIDRGTDSGEYDDSNDADEDTLPSLGYLDEALQFIAAERAKLTAPRDNSWHRGHSATSDDPPQRSTATAATTPTTAAAATATPSSSTSKEQKLGRLAAQSVRESASLLAHGSC